MNLCIRVISAYNVFTFQCNPFKAAVEYRKKVRQACSNIRKVARDHITACIENVQRGEKLDNNILAHILQTSTGLDSLAVTDAELEKMVDQFVTFFLAGRENIQLYTSSFYLELGL